MASGDFDNDGKADVVVGLPLFLKTYRGTPEGLQEAASLASSAGAVTTHLVPGDVDNDGLLDLVAPINGGQTGNYYVVKGLGGGAFAAPVLAPLPKGASDLTLGDFNNDGKLDFVAAHASVKLISFATGNGDGTFGPAVLIAVPTASPVKIASGDFDGDGKRDVAMNGAPSGNLAVALGNGAGGFAAPVNYAGTATALNSLDAGDFDHDGKADVVVAGGQQVGFFRSLGAAGLAPVQLHSLMLARIHAVDVNGDGHLDVAGTTEAPSFVNVLVGDGAGSFTPKSHPAIRRCRDVAVLDANLDGLLDFAIIHFLPNLLTVLEGNVLGGYGPAPSNVLANGAGDVAVGDVNGDLIPDVAVASPLTQKITLLAGAGGGRLTPAGEIQGAGFGRDVKLRDVDYDGTLDALWLAYNTNEFRVSLGLGSGGFGAPVGHALGNAPGLFRWQLADLDGDGDVDAAASNYASDTLESVVGDGAGGFVGAASLTLSGELASILELEDVTGDGVLDAITVRTSSTTPGVNAGLVVVPGTGTGGFSAAHAITLPQSPMAIVATDLDNDGAVDIVGGGVGAIGYVILYKGTQGGFANPVIANFPNAYPSDFVAGDVNGDGHVDVVASGYTWNEVLTFRGKGDGTLLEPEVTEAGLYAPGIPALADMDADGRLDLVVGGTNETTLRVLLNRAEDAGGVAHYGTGTPSCAGKLTLAATHRAQIGTTFTVLQANSPPNAPMLLVVAAGSDLTGSDLFGLGVLVHLTFPGGTQVSAFDATTDDAGVARIDVPIAADPTLAGTQLFAQAFALEDPGAGLGCSPSSTFLVSSEGLAFTIQ
jgi:hypothetical protein